MTIFGPYSSNITIFTCIKKKRRKEACSKKEACFERNRESTTRNADVGILRFSLENSSSLLICCLSLPRESRLSRARIDLESAPSPILNLAAKSERRASETARLNSRSARGKGRGGDAMCATVARRCGGGGSGGGKWRIVRGCACHGAEQESERGGGRRARSYTPCTHGQRALGGEAVVEERHSERDAARWHVSIAEGSGARCGRRCTLRESLPRTPKE